VDSKAADPTKVATYNYDVVNLGREALAQVVSRAHRSLVHEFTSGVAQPGKHPVITAG
jgi:hypothetical protein